MNKFWMIPLALLGLMALSATATAQIDLRSYQHGIDFTPLPDGSYYLFWSTTTNPPFAAGGSWPHDVYYARIDPTSPAIKPTLFISKPEAQEPVSAAITKNGRIMLTFEDGWDAKNVLAQRYGVYDTDLNPVKPYPQTVFDGGHSGHVAAAGNRFIVFYSNEWVEGGGVDNLGSGDDVLAKIYSSEGNEEHAIEVAVGSATRDWWPLVAGSPSRAALVWQRFVDDRPYVDLMFALLDPVTGDFIHPPVRLEKQVEYYTYSIEYVPAIDRFLLTGTYKAGGGFAFLLDGEGRITARHELLPPIVRESQPVTRSEGDGAIAVQPTASSGIMVLSLTPDSIALNQTIADKYEWEYIGVDGIFLTPKTVYFVALSSKGLVEKRFTIDLDAAPTPTATPNPDSVLLSQGRPAVSSSNETETLTPEKAVDGSLSTRWASLEGHDPEWIYVDLGKTAIIERVLLDWDARAKVYEIQVSDDARNWTTIYREEGGRGDADEITGLAGRGRYVRMFGLKRGTPWGYSLNEFQVYGAFPRVGGGGASSTASTEGTAVPSVPTTVPTSEAEGAGHY